MNLFLDDFRMPHDAGDYCSDTRYRTEQWEVVRNYDEFVKFIRKQGLPDLISFDHDLDDSHYAFRGDYNELEKTGYHCAKWLVNYCINEDVRLPECLVHSMNPVGKENISSYLNNFEKHYEKHRI